MEADETTPGPAVAEPQPAPTAAPPPADHDPAETPAAPRDTAEGYLADRDAADVGEGGRGGGDRPWRRALWAALGIFVASKAGLAAVSAFAWIGVKRPNVTAGYIAAQWASWWDSDWFLEVARRGYYPEPDSAPAAFFPMYPMLIRALTPLCLGKDWVAALLVANLAMFGALAVLFRLTEHEFDRATAGRTTFYLVAFPTGFFLTAAYNEGLFIGLMVATVYCLRRQQWWWAGGFGALAAFTRSAGVLMIGVFIYEYVRVHGIRRRSIERSALAVLLIPLGLVGVMAFSLQAYHQPFAFLRAQRYWGRHLDWPWAPVLRGIGSLHSGAHLRYGFGDLWVHNLLELATALLMITMLVLMFIGPWRVRRDQWILPLLGAALTFLMISFPSSHQPYPLYSASRLGLEVFPAFMLLGRLGARPGLDRIVLALFLMLQGILVAYFVRGGWVA
jgi:hypothetical protein